jgi:opacity protein-like surface antigen
MSLMRSGILAAIAVIGGATVAAAADLRPAFKAPPAPPPPVADWSGIYTGWEGGYGWGHESFDPAFDPFFAESSIMMMETWITGGPTPIIDSIHQSGWLFGGFVGAQKQWSNWVIGIEANYDGANIKGSATSSAGISNVECTLGLEGAAVSPVAFQSILRSMDLVRCAARPAGHLRRIGWYTLRAARPTRM